MCNVCMQYSKKCFAWLLPQHNCKLKDVDYVLYIFVSANSSTVPSHSYELNKYFELMDEQNNSFIKVKSRDK